MWTNLAGGAEYFAAAFLGAVMGGLPGCYLCIRYTERKFGDIRDSGLAALFIICYWLLTLIAGGLAGIVVGIGLVFAYHRV